MEEEEKGKSAGRAATEAVAKIAATTSEMAQKHNLFRNLLDNIPDSIYFKDKEHRFIAVSKAKAEHHGVDPEDFVGKTDFDFYPEEQARKMQEDDDYVVKTKEPIIGKEEKVIRPDGTARWYSVTKVPYRNDEGNIIGSIGISRDITERKQAENKLRESEKRYHDLIENTPVGILGIDENGTIIYENLTMRKILGVPEGEFDESLGTKLAELLNVIATGHADKVGELLKGNPVSGIVTPFVSVYGRRSLLLVDGLPLKDSEGRITGGLLMIQEITERKRAEEALRESEQRYRALFGSTLDCVFVIDAETMRIVLANEAAAKLVGFDSAEDAIGMNPLDFVLPEDRDRVIRIIAEDMFAKDLRQVNEFRAITRDGREIWVRAVGARIKYQGRLAGLVSLYDITERKQAEERYKTILQTSMDGFWIADIRGRFLEVNDAYCRLIGYSRDELLKMGIPDVEAIEKPEETAARIQKIMKTGGDRFETRHRCKDGRIVDVEVSVNYLDVEDGRLFVFLRDVTERKQAEEALARERYLMRAFMDNIPDRVYFKDTESRFIRISKAQADAFGLGDPIEAVGKTDFDFFTEEHARLAHEDEQGIIRTGKPLIGIEERETWPGRPDTWVSTSKLPLRDEDGNIAGTFGISRDITDRKRAEEALRESEASYRKLADSITDVFFAMDNDLKYTYWNKASENLTRIPAKDAIGKSLYELFPDTPETRNAERVYREVLRTQQPQTFVNEYPLGGKGFFFEISAYPSKHGLSVFVKDITERQRAEEALKESEEKFRALAEQSPNMIFINKGGRVVYANKRCEEVMGYTRYELYSADFDFLDLIAPEYRESVKTNFGKHIRGEEVEPYEFALVTKEGRRVEAIHTTRLIDYEGVKAILGIATDITQHKKAEKERIALERTAARLKALDRMKDEFLSMTSHELKTPLTSIRSFLQLMESGKLGKITGKQEEALAIISTGVERLGGSIDKLLRISKLELGEMKLEMKNLQLADFIQNTVKKMKSLAKQKRVTLAQKVAELPVIRADGEQLTEVLTNLVDNAIKFTPEGGKVTIEAKSERDNILVMVKDTGIGIAKKDMPKLFTKFFQVEHSVPGTGLGLSICKKIILGHGGRIWAKSTLGRGSTFFFTLPIKK